MNNDAAQQDREKVVLKGTPIHFLNGKQFCKENGFISDTDIVQISIDSIISILKKETLKSVTIV